MSTTGGIRALVGVALASSVFLLAGCASSGSTGAKSSSGGGLSTSSSSSDKASSSSSSSSSSSDSSSSPSSDSSSSSSDSSGGSTGGLGEDPGCKAAEEVATSGPGKMNVSDPAGTKKALNDLASQLHDAAGKAQKPGAAAAINKLADDYAGLATAISTGKMPDVSSMMDDATKMASACTS
jgi:hypothetical protein